jgi:hypothetical protein
MTTRRIQIPRNADGSPKSYEERRAERRAADHQRQRSEQQQRQQAKAEAILNPPAPLPTYAERKQQRKHEQHGREDAAFAAEQRAAAEAGPVNPYRQRANELSAILYRPGMQRRYELAVKQADEWDRQREAEQEAAAQRAAIDADPMVRTAREYAAGLLKLAPAEFQGDAAEIAGIAQAGDSKLAWERMRDLEQRIWTWQDQQAVAKREAKAITDSEFSAAANAAEAARERFEHASTMAAE